MGLPPTRASTSSGTGRFTHFTTAQGLHGTTRPSACSWTAVTCGRAPTAASRGFRVPTCSTSPMARRSVLDAAVFTRGRRHEDETSANGASWRRPGWADPRRRAPVSRPQPALVRIEADRLSTNRVPPPVRVENSHGRRHRHRHGCSGAPSRRAPPTSRSTTPRCRSRSRNGLRFRYRLEGFRPCLGRGRRTGGSPTTPACQPAITASAWWRANEDGVWNEQGAVLRFRIPRHWWGGRRQPSCSSA